MISNTCNTFAVSVHSQYRNTITHHSVVKTTTNLFRFSSRPICGLQPVDQPMAQPAYESTERFPLSNDTNKNVPAVTTKIQNQGSDAIKPTLMLFLAGRLLTIQVVIRGHSMLHVTDYDQPLVCGPHAEACDLC